MRSTSSRRRRTVNRSRSRQGSRRTTGSRHRSSRRHTARGRRRGGPGTATRALIVGGAIAVVALLLVGARLGLVPTAPRETATGNVKRHLVYTAPTRNDATITLPPSVRDDLLSVGREHGSVALTRIDSTGQTSTTVVDLTPRTGDDPKDRVLTVPERAAAKIDAIISSAIEAPINDASATTPGRSLYTGLTKTDFEDVPVTIISSGLDLADPVDFRDLAWKVTAKRVVQSAVDSGAIAAINGPVVFTVVPSTGTQPQLGQAQKQYRNAVWRSLLTASGATEVTFIDAVGGPAKATTPVPPVSLPGPGTTPTVEPTSPPVTAPPSPVATCKVQSSFFVVNTARLIDRARTITSLRGCISRAEQVDATYELDGYTSYDGPLDRRGRPAEDARSNRRLSRDRVEAIANLLVHDLDVTAGDITRKTAHGNTDQPDPDPRSEANRVVIITYTPSAR